MQVFIKPITDNPTAQVAIAAVGVLIVLDVLTGFVGAALTRSISSQKMREGLLHKFMEIVLVVLADIIDGALLGGFDILGGNPLLIATCAYIALMEVSSILEIVGKYNPDLADGGILSIFEKKE
jgi:phage-related holin